MSSALYEKPQPLNGLGCEHGEIGLLQTKGNPVEFPSGVRVRNATTAKMSRPPGKAIAKSHARARVRWVII